jgi:hypothetical protein
LPLPCALLFLTTEYKLPPLAQGVQMFHSSITRALLTSCLLAGGLACFGQTPDPAPANAVPAPTLNSAPLVYVPLTQSERARRYAKSLFSLEAIGRSAAGAGIQQLTNTPREWGQGAEGYGRRFASSFGENMVRQTITYGLSSALDEDNRYFSSERTGFGSRTMYAAESTFLARRSDGTRKLSYSRIIGLVATAFISRAWQPPSERGLSHAAGSLATNVGTEISFNIAREFLPSLLHRHQN